MRGGDLVGGRYRLMQRMSQGTSGVVWKAEELLQGQPIADVAMKIFTVDVNHQEIATLAKLQHAHILSYRTVVEHDGRVCLITEFADGGDLTQALRSHPAGLPVEQVMEIVRAIAEALRYLHAQSWVHRDIKPSNILYVGTTPKLGDVGTAKAVGNALTRHTGVGSIAYSAPELFSGQVGPASDLYSLGITAFELLTGKLPFDGPPEVVMRQHMGQEPAIPAEFPESVRMFLAGCLTKSPERRSRASDVLELLQTRSSSVSAPAAAAPAVLACPPRAASPAMQPPPAAAPSAPHPSPSSAMPDSGVPLPADRPKSAAPAPDPVPLRPEQILAKVTLHIRNHFQRHAKNWESPDVWGPFWQELKEMSAPLHATDSDLLRQVQALLGELNAPVVTQQQSTPPPSSAAAPSAAQPPPKESAEPTRRQAPPAVRRALTEFLQNWGGRWSQSELWQPFWSKLQQAAPGFRERDAILLGEELERQLAVHTKQQQQFQLRVLQWVSSQQGRSFVARDWLQLLDSLSGEGLTDEVQAAHYRDEAMQRLFPKQTGEVRKVRVHGDLSLEFVFLGKDVLLSAIPITDMAETVLGRDAKQRQSGAAQPSAKGVWLSLTPVSIVQWYTLLQHPLPPTATKPEATARVLQRGVVSEFLPRLQKRFPLEGFRLATRAEVHVLRKLITPESQDRTKNSRESAAGSASLLEFLGKAAIHVLEQVAHENQEWFQNDALPAGDSQDKRKLPFRLVSVVPG